MSFRSRPCDNLTAVWPGAYGVDYGCVDCAASRALAAADKLRDRFGESAVSLASGMKGRYHERVHENPVGLPGKIEGDRPRKGTAPPTSRKEPRG